MVIMRQDPLDGKKRQDPEGDLQNVLKAMVGSKVMMKFEEKHVRSV